MNINTTNNINWTRVIFSVVYFLLGFLTIYILRDNIFYLLAKKDSYNIYRFYWCLSSSAIGFAVIVLRTIYHPKSPFPTYITYYPFILVLISTLVFSVLHLFESTSGFVFYYFSFSLCFMLSYLIDKFWDMIFVLLKKNSSK